MDGRGKNGEKLPISCYLRSSLTAQSVTPRRGWGSGAAGGSGGAARAPPHGCAAGRSERLVHTLRTCKLVVLEFHDEEASPPFPRFLQPAVLLLFLLICSIRRVRVLRVPSLPLCRCALCTFTLYPILLCVLPRMFEVPISGVPAKFWSQHLFLTLSRRSSFGAFKDVAFLILCFSDTQVTWSTDMIVKVLI